MIRILALAVLLTACGGGNSESPGDSSPLPPDVPAGTVLSSTCEENYTLVEQVADGNGGSYVRRTPDSPECGYVPPPAGTLLNSGCSKDYVGVKWFIYADGNGGTYTEKESKVAECGWNPPEAGTVKEQYCDEFTQVTVYHDGEYGTYEERQEKSEECGYVEPVEILELTLEKGTGDMFDPVVIKVSYTLDGEPVEWSIADASVTKGNIERVNTNTVHIYGDYRIGDGIFTLGSEEIQYTIVDEPRCAHTKASNGITTDCEGHRVDINSQRNGFIYYGEEDTRIVEWEIGIVIWGGHTEFGEDLKQGIISEYEVGSEEWNKWQKRIMKANELLERSGVYVRYVLHPGNLVRGHWHSNRGIEYVAEEFMTKTDVVLGWGDTCPDACGCARPNISFPEGRPPAGTISYKNQCDHKTDVHEIGHAVGLAHGPENSGYPASGYIFSTFGHGWENLCGEYGSIMSYDSRKEAHSNSRMTCGQWLDGITRGRTGNPDSPAGSRQYTDAAYALNRVRYDVSLIHNEKKYVTATDALFEIDAPPRHRFDVIVD